MKSDSSMHLYSSPCTQFPVEQHSYLQSTVFIELIGNIGPTFSPGAPGVYLLQSVVPKDYLSGVGVDTRRCRIVDLGCLSSVAQTRRGKFHFHEIFGIHH